jgi:hypothetical protein
MAIFKKYFNREKWRDGTDQEEKKKFREDRNRSLS